MKITFFCIEFPVASETFIQNQIISFINMGHDVNILSLYPGDIERQHENFHKYGLDKIVTYIFPYGIGEIKKRKIIQERIINSLKCFIKGGGKAFNVEKYGHLSSKLLLPSIVGKIKTKYDADFFIAHFGTCGVVANSLRDMNILNGKIATVFHGFDISISEILNRYSRLYANLFKEGDLFLPISHKWKRELVSLGCEASKIKVIRMGIHVAEFAYKPRVCTEQLNIISVCRLVEKKGIEYSIRACLILKQKKIPFYYTIIGFGPLENELRLLIDKIGLSEFVAIKGFQSQDKVKHMLDISSVFVLPSITSSNGDMEGIPVALMEAMANGLPVVSTYHSGIPELIEDGINGYLCEEKNIEHIAKKLMFIFNNPNEVSEVIPHARNKIESDFNIEKEYNKLALILEDYL